jgi:hypothetical protein
MKQLLLFTLLGLIFSVTNAQPAIDSTDMPAPKDTVKRTQVSNLSAITYTATGSNFVWDFSVLEGNNETVDTFISVFSTPIAYIATYSNPFDQEHRATVASYQAAFQSPPGVTITDPYAFFKADNDFYGQVGFGASINGLTVPVKFDHADVMYRFPLQMGNTDTSISEYNLSIPGFGYYGERKIRINHVDGWGTLYLPADTFAVVRVRSDMQIYDTIHLDSLGFGFGFDRNETEYKWLAKGYKLPVFQVNKRQGGMGGNNASGLFIDHRPANWGTPDLSSPGNIKVSPVPAFDLIKVTNPFAPGKSRWIISDMTGRLIDQGESPNDHMTLSVRGLQQGLYLLRIISEGKTAARVIIKG